MTTVPQALNKRILIVAGMTLLLFLAGIVLLPGIGAYADGVNAQSKPDAPVLAGADKTQEPAPAVTHNTWSTARNGACGGGIGPQIYVAGGGTSSGTTALTEAFKVSKNTWQTLAPLPQAAIVPGSAVYKGRLYCFGGVDPSGNPISNKQVYQP
ncbi:MAG TPA: kelch repeat-containing protein [Terriglobales bacterium]|nr:kelch repeat-containing protein [Terriglobales bacterium]